MVASITLPTGTLFCLSLKSIANTASSVTTHTRNSTYPSLLSQLRTYFCLLLKLSRNAQRVEPSHLGSTLSFFVSRTDEAVHSNKKSCAVCGYSRTPSRLQASTYCYYYYCIWRCIESPVVAQLIWFRRWLYGQRSSGFGHIPDN